MALELIIALASLYPVYALVIGAVVLTVFVVASPVLFMVSGFGVAYGLFVAVIGHGFSELLIAGTVFIASSIALAVLGAVGSKS